MAVSAAITDDQLLFAVLLGIGGCVLGLLALVRLPSTVGRSERYGWLLAFILGGLAGATALIGKPWALWAPVVAVSGLWSLLRLLRAPVVRRALRAAAQLGTSTGQLVLLLLLAPLPILALLIPPAQPGLAVPFNAPGPLQPVSVLLAHTDRGTPITLLAVDPTPFSPSQVAIEEQFVRNAVQNSTMLPVSPADPTCNCHGWIFTGGRYVIDGSQVDAILGDNGYAKIEQPQVDDLIVYRNKEGVVMHTALVRLVTAEGLVLIESKWGQMGRYLHKPQDLRYPFSFTYHRSRRGQHSLRDAAFPVSRPATPRPNA